MDKKSIGKALIDMREKDELRFIDKEKNKEYCVYECFYRYDNLKGKQVVEFAIREIKKYDKRK